jgi:hypothetical protein
VQKIASYGYDSMSRFKLYNTFIYLVPTNVCRFLGFKRIIGCKFRIIIIFVKWKMFLALGLEIIFKN